MRDAYFEALAPTRFQDWLARQEPPTEPHGHWPPFTCIDGVVLWFEWSEDAFWAKLQVGLRMSMKHPNPAIIEMGRTTPITRYMLYNPELFRSIVGRMALIAFQHHGADSKLWKTAAEWEEHRLQEAFKRAAHATVRFRRFNRAFNRARRTPFERKYRERRDFWKQELREAEETLEERLRRKYGD